MAVKEFKIRFHSGLGDCFRMLTEQPSINLVNERQGLKIYWVYDRSELEEVGTLSIDKEYPLHAVLQNIFKNVNFLNQISQKEYVNLQIPELNNWKIRDRLSQQLKGIYPGEEIPGFDIPCSVNEEEQLDKLLSKKGISICVQLTGKDEKKQYSNKNYVELFKLILTNYPYSKIFLFDNPVKTVDKSLLFDVRIFDVTRRFTLTQHINLIKKADYLIAPDSYSKYIRRWVNGRQSILCTTLDYISNRSILEGCFGDFKNPNTAGLLFNPDVKLLGVKYTGNLDNLEIVHNINDITPNDVFDSIKLKS
jgi:hypothetical protein